MPELLKKIKGVDIFSASVPELADRASAGRLGGLTAEILRSFLFEDVLMSDASRPDVERFEATVTGLVAKAALESRWLDVNSATELVDPRFREEFAYFLHAYNQSYRAPPEQTLRKLVLKWHEARAPGDSTGVFPRTSPDIVARQWGGFLKKAAAEVFRSSTLFLESYCKQPNAPVWRSEYERALHVWEALALRTRHSDCEGFINILDPRFQQLNWIRTRLLKMVEGLNEPLEVSFDALVCQWREVPLLRLYAGESFGRWRNLWQYLRFASQQLVWINACGTNPTVPEFRAFSKSLLPLVETPFTPQGTRFFLPTASAFCQRVYKALTEGATVRQAVEDARTLAFLRRPHAINIVSGATNPLPQHLWMSLPMHGIPDSGTAAEIIHKYGPFRSVPEEIQSPKGSKNTIVSHWVPELALGPKGERIRLLKPIRLTPASRSGLVCAQGWGVEIDPERIGDLPRRLARQFLRLLHSAETKSLADQEKPIWRHICDSVDFRQFTIEQSPPRYAEGTLCSRDNGVVVEWHDGHRETLSEEVAPSLDLVDLGEHFSAFVKLGTEDRTVGIERVSLLPADAYKQDWTSWPMKQ